jgi:hypothetical protein
MKSELKLLQNSNIELTNQLQQLQISLQNLKELQIEKEAPAIAHVVNNT